MRFVTCIVSERQLRLYGHLAHFPDADPAHQILSAREYREWRMPMGRPHASELQQVDRHLKEMGMGQASAWWMARRRPLEYWWKVDTATRYSACTCTGDLLNLSLAHMHGFPHTCTAWWHVPHGFDAAACPLPTRLRRCRSTWFVRRSHNLLNSVMHHGPKFEFRLLIRTPHTTHTPHGVICTHFYHVHVCCLHTSSLAETTDY